MVNNKILKAISYFICSILIAVTGMVGIAAFLSPDTSIWNFKTFILYSISYFVMIRPTIDYWFIKLQKLFGPIE